jgi:hypothetical protein
MSEALALKPHLSVHLLLVDKVFEHALSIVNLQIIDLYGKMITMGE